MDQYWFKRSGRFGAMAIIAFATPTALVQADYQEFDPPPGDFWGHVDIPEIGFGGGTRKTGDTKIDDPWGVFTTGDDLLSQQLSNWSLSLSNGDFAISSEPTIGVTVDSGTGSLAPESIFTTDDTLSSNLFIEPTIPAPSSTFGDGAQPDGSAIPTPGAGVLLIGGLVLLGSRRRRSS